MNMREEFEKHIPLPEGVEWCATKQGYVGKNFWLADHGLSVWKASRAALVVELPQENEYGRITYSSAMRAIHAAGVSTK